MRTLSPEQKYGVLLALTPFVFGAGYIAGLLVGLYQGSHQ